MYGWRGREKSLNLHAFAIRELLKSGDKKALLGKPEERQSFLPLEEIPDDKRGDRHGRTGRAHAKAPPTDRTRSSGNLTQTVQNGYPER